MFLMSEVPLQGLGPGVRELGFRGWGLGFRGQGVGTGAGSREEAASASTASWCRGTLLIRSTPLLGPYSRAMPRVIWWS